MILLSVLLLAATSSRAEPLSLLEQGAALFQTGRLTKAAAIYEDVAKSSPSLEAFLDAAIVYRDLGEPEKSYVMFQRAVVLAPQDPFIQTSYGWAALRAGQQTDADSAFSLALQLRPGYRHALLGRGRVLLDGRHASEAVAALEELTKKHPEFTLGWLYLARAYWADGKGDQAVEAYRKTYQSDSTFSEVRLALGALYKELKNFNEAWRQYSLVLALDPGHALAMRYKRDLQRLVTRGPETTGDAVPVVESVPGAVVSSISREKMPVLRVGVGTTASGRPLLRKALVFRCTGDFRVIDPGDRRVLAQGTKGERFAIRQQGGGFEILDPKHKPLMKFRRVVQIEPLDPEKESVIVQEVRIAHGFAWSSIRDRQLKGRVEVRARGARMELINELPLEDYLYGVVTEEMPTRFPMEALKAQAVIARTHLMYQAKHLHPHRRYGYDVCDGQHCQVYSGVGGESPEARVAADATRGQVLTHRDRLAQTPYASNCGGRTQGSGEIAGWTELPYLRGSTDDADEKSEPWLPWKFEHWIKDSPDVFCKLVPDMPAARFRWVRAIPADELESRVNRVRRIGRIKRVVVVRRSASGYANEVWVEGDKGVAKLDREHLIRRTLGLGSLRSTKFIVETERDPKGKPTEFLFFGGGWGHGVGLCQYGAAGRALKGQTYFAILNHYFPGTTLSTLDY